MESDTLVEPGPNLPYVPHTIPRWADYSDMQVDPNGCGFWSFHILVNDPGGDLSK